MGKYIKIGLGIAVFAGAAFYGIKVAMAPRAAPVQAQQPAETSVQDSMGVAALAKGALGTVKISEDLSVPDSKLPDGCRMVKKMDPSSFFPATSNPFITEKPELVDFVATAGFGTVPLIDVSEGAAVLFSDQAGEKTGVWGLQFRSAATAANMLPLMRSIVVLKKDALLLTFYHDGSDACEVAVRRYYTGKGFESQVGGPR